MSANARSIEVPRAVGYGRAAQLAARVGRKTTARIGVRTAFGLASRGKRPAGVVAWQPRDIGMDGLAVAMPGVAREVSAAKQVLLIRRGVCLRSSHGAPGSRDGGRDRDPEQQRAPRHWSRLPAGYAVEAGPDTLGGADSAEEREVGKDREDPRFGRRGGEVARP